MAWLSTTTLVWAARAVQAAAGPVARRPVVLRAAAETTKRVAQVAARAPAAAAAKAEQERPAPRAELVVPPRQVVPQ
jgi:hypothetical protein